MEMCVSREEERAVTNFSSFESDRAPVLLLCTKARIRHLAVPSCSSPAQVHFGCPSKMTYAEAVSVDGSQDESYMTL